MLKLKGKKIGMTKIFNDNGSSTAVSMVQLTKNLLLSKVSDDKVLLCSGEKKYNKLNKPEKGICKKYKIDTYRSLFEAKNSSVYDNVEPGSELSVNLFDLDKNIKVTGVSKGKGFAGVIKRWNFAMQDATHGNSLSHRAHGSTGQNQDPGKVFKGKKMAGHMGSEKVTLSNKKILKIDEEKNIVIIKGSIPGANNTEITLMQE